MSKVIVIGALPSSLINFRGELLTALVAAGHQVIGMACGANDEEIAKLRQMGVEYINYNVQRNGLNPISDFATMWQLKTIFKKLQPDVILAYTIKPVIWGGIAAKSLKLCRFYALVTGLGFAFQRGGFKRNILVNLVTNLYRIGLRQAAGIIFQNPDNRQVFVDLGICASEKTFRVHGSGVKLEHFARHPLPMGQPVFLTVARLLGEKGLREYAQAAIEVKKQCPSARFLLVGPFDPSPDGIKQVELDRWVQHGAIEYLGETKDVRPFIHQCNIFVLASYHEGMPRTVLEAMAIGRPILTTQVPGCKETVEPGVNGFLVPKADVEQLKKKMLWFVDNQSQWQRMSDSSYALALSRYDVHKVNNDLLEIMKLGS